MMMIIIIRYVNTCLQVTNGYYELVPESVLNVNGTTIMWHVPVITGRKIVAN